MSKYEPTEAEVEALALRLAKYHCASAEAALSQEYDDARWLLKHYEPRSDEQRCSGRGRLKLGNDHFALCPGCTRCEPRETPKSDTNALLHPDSKCSCEAEGWCEYCRTHCIHCGAREEMHSACREFVPPPPAAPAAESEPACARCGHRYSLHFPGKTGMPCADVDCPCICFSSNGVGIAASESTAELLAGATESAAPVATPRLNPTQELGTSFAHFGWNTPEEDNSMIAVRASVQLLADLRSIALDILAELRREK